MFIYIYPGEKGEKNKERKKEKKKEKEREKKTRTEKESERKNQGERERKTRIDLEGRLMGVRSIICKVFRIVYFVFGGAKSKINGTILFPSKLSSRKLSQPTFKQGEKG